MTSEYVISFTALGMNAVPTVGGKNASLGEMISQLDHVGISVPEGFATTADAFRLFLEQDGLKGRIDRALAPLDVDDIQQLTRTGEQIRHWIMETPLPKMLSGEITQH